jgi:adenylyltransferase/sulfurtransferase
LSYNGHDVPTDRYHRQSLLPQIGPPGQDRLRRARVLLVGCGALGTVIAEHLVRAGIGELRLVDRDIVELTNLQRQTLFTEADVTAGAPKAVAAAERLAQVNADVHLIPRPIDVDAGNIEALATGPSVDLILDGTDNVETRYLINDVAIKHGIPWIYGAAVGTEGRVMGILPGKSPCLRCVFQDVPKPADLATCDTAGVLAPATATVASLQVVEAIKILLGHVPTTLLALDVWTQRFRTLDLADSRRADCPCCGQRQFEFLARASRLGSITLCGRNAVQVRGDHPLHLADVATRLMPVAELQQTRFMVRARLRDPQDVTLTVFPDGRTLVSGTSDLARARSLVSRFVGT